MLYTKLGGLRLSKQGVVVYLIQMVNNIKKVLNSL